MREFLLLIVHLLVTMTRLMKPGGARAIVAENLLLKQQRLVACRARRRAPCLSPLDRFLFGLWPLFLNTFWNATDLQRKLDSFQTYYNTERVHASHDSQPPVTSPGNPISLTHFRWRRCCCGLCPLPLAA